MTGKYNIAVHALFWCLAGALVFITAVILLTDSGNMDEFFVRTETVVEKEPVYITKIHEAEQETEWFYFIATGYSANDPEQGTNNITATGKEIKKGMIAVDADIIPLGTKVEIKDMGVFTAEDTGGKIRGNRVDIYFETKSQAEKFGRRVIWIRLLDRDIELAENLSR